MFVNASGCVQKWQVPWRSSAGIPALVLCRWRAYGVIGVNRVNLTPAPTRILPARSRHHA